MAKALLREEPTEADALVLLARIADLRNEPTALAQFETVLVRAPRNQYARAWMIDHWMQSGDYLQALNHIDRLLNMAPWHREGIVSLLIVKMQGELGWTSPIRHRGALASNRRHPFTRPTPQTQQPKTG